MIELLLKHPLLLQTTGFFFALTSGIILIFIRNLFLSKKAQDKVLQDHTVAIELLKEIKIEEDKVRIIALEVIGPLKTTLDEVREDTKEMSKAVQNIALTLARDSAKRDSYHRED